MIKGYLLDEHLPAWWRREIIKRAPGLRVWRIGDPKAPPFQSPDPFILEWCETHDFILLTNNRSSMPVHLGDHLARDRQVSGIFLVDPAMHIAKLAEALNLIAGASFVDEYRDQIQYLPAT
jgi:hypothetical protein